MPKINVDSDYFDHPKTHRLKVYCGNEADIFPIRLWCICAKYFYKDGTITGFTGTEIERLVQWEGTAGDLIGALEKVGFVEKCGENYKIHDWKIHAGFIMKYKIAGKIAGKKSGESRRLMASAKRTNRSRTVNDPRTIELNGIELNSNKDKDNYLVVPPPKNGDGPTPEDVVRLWNDTAHPSLPKVQLLTEPRKRKTKARLIEHPEKSFWDSLMMKINRSPLLTGQSGKWRCSFDWILEPSNLTKILEGNYDADIRR